MKKKINIRNIFIWSIVLILIVSVGRSDLYRDISSNWRLMYEVYKRVMTDYADSIDPQKLASAGIEGMLKELDPYSVYLVNEDRHQLNVLTKGNYGGVGIQLSVRNDSLTVIAPMDDSPAQRAGIISGDRIIAVNDHLTSDMNMDEAAKKIRGPKNTKVDLRIRRWGVEDVNYELIRSTIIIKDVSYSGMINEVSGYVRLNRFSRNSSTEMREALRSLINQDARTIILDLRGNPGGLMDAAINIVDMFVKKGVEIVSMNGRSEQSTRSFKSQNEPIIDSSIRIAVLIDGGSASASEIVAGSIQDLDRGIVIGTNSFGKGLVQTAFQLDESRILKMTTAKYYIPSGRLIQKPGYLRGDIAIDNENIDSVFTTNNGRRVVSSGGITPDYIIDQEPVPLLTREIWRRGFFFQFSSRYHNENKLNIPITISDAIIIDFQDFLDSKELKLISKGEKELTRLEELLSDVSETDKGIEHSLSVIRKHYETDKNQLFLDEKNEISLMLERELSWVLEGLSGRIESSFDDDPVILKALEILSDQYVYGSTLNPSMN